MGARFQPAGRAASGNHNSDVKERNRGAGGERRGQKQQFGGGAFLGRDREGQGRRTGGVEVSACRIILQI